MLIETRNELLRLDARDVHIEFDDEFEPEAGTLVKVEYDGAFWHLLPGKFTELLNDLPDGAGGEAIKVAIETKAQTVWHGPSPHSRDTSP